MDNITTVSRGVTRLVLLLVLLVLTRVATRAILRRIRRVGDPRVTGCLPEPRQFYNIFSPDIGPSHGHRTAGKSDDKNEVQSDCDVLLVRRGIDRCEKRTQAKCSPRECFNDF